MKRHPGAPVALALIAVVQGFAYNTSYTVNTTLDKSPISPYIFGMNVYSTNQNYHSPNNDVENFSVKRAGGDSWTTYNWENNFNNAGHDYGPNANYDWLTAGFSAAKKLVPAMAMTDFVDSCHGRGCAAMVTLQLGGYVAADNAGNVAASPPNSRWKKVVVNKGASYSPTPDLADSFVYQDEMVHLLLQKYGSASTATGVRFYDLDNEPDCWNSTHGLMHPAATTCTELITKSIQTAAMVKRLDPSAMVVGPSLCCFYGYYGLSNAPDWNAVKGSHQWFVSWYLDKMKKASDSVGVRLLDVMDLHLYPAGTMNGWDSLVWQPRSLWDSGYVEDSWIPQSGFRQYLPYLPRIISNINQYFPGTKIGATEYNYVPHGDEIGAAVATADVFGIDTKYGVYLTCWWAIYQLENYVSAAFQIYRNYDGNQSTYGDTAVRALPNAPDSANSSVYASLKGHDLHIMLINKKQSEALNASFTITSPDQYTAGDVYQLTGAGPKVTKLSTGIAVAGNAFSITVPQASVSHLVFKASAGVRRAAPHSADHARVWFDPESRTLWYALPGPGAATLTVNDMTGKVVLSARNLCGSGTLAMKLGEYAHGLYCVTAASRDRTFMQRVTVVE